MKIVVDRTQLRRVLVVAKDRFQFFLLHAVLRCVLQIQCETFQP